MWLYKAWMDGVLIDVIFRSSGEIYLDDEMVERAVERDIRGTRTRVISAEDFLVIKAVATTEQGSHHWYDALGIIARYPIDWAYLVGAGPAGRAAPGAQPPPLRRVERHGRARRGRRAAVHHRPSPSDGGRLDMSEHERHDTEGHSPYLAQHIRDGAGGCLDRRARRRRRRRRRLRVPHRHGGQRRAPGRDRAGRRGGGRGPPGPQRRRRSCTPDPIPRSRCCRDQGGRRRRCARRARVRRAAAARLRRAWPTTPTCSCSPVT